MEDVRNEYFNNTLIQAKEISIQFFLDERPSVYIVRYEGDNEEATKYTSNLIEHLTPFLGLRNIICPSIKLRAGDIPADEIEKMGKCNFIIVIGTPELIETYRSYESDSLSNAELRTTFRELQKNSTKIIPYYMGQTQNFLPNYLQGYTAAPLNNSKDYQKNLLNLLCTLTYRAPKIQDQLILLEKEFNDAIIYIESLSSDDQKELFDEVQEALKKRSDEKKQQTKENLKAILNKNKNTFSQKPQPIKLPENKELKNKIETKQKNVENELSLEDELLNMQNEQQLRNSVSLRTLINYLEENCDKDLIGHPLLRTKIKEQSVQDFEAFIVKTNLTN